jgi:hypothetical protein
MREMVHFRLSEAEAEQFLAPGDGTVIDRSVRKISVQMGDPVYERIADRDNELRAAGKMLVFSWSVTREYTRQEVETADLFQMLITAAFEPDGEACGAVYVEGSECSVCGTGRKLVSDLVLDLRAIPRKDVARSLAEEWVVSQRVAELVLAEGLTGVELRPVRHKTFPHDPSVDPELHPSGRELLSKARDIGLVPSDWRFWVWMNESEQRDLVDQLRAEAAATLRRPTKPSEPRYHLAFSSTRVSAVPPSRFGISLFDEDSEGRYRCPRCAVAGLNLLTELTVSRDEWDGSDFTITREYAGWKRGVLRPYPLIVVSPRVRRLFTEHRITGVRFEVANMV